MPVCEADPWRMQYFERVPCPDDVRVPTEDGDAYLRHPAYKWVYNKLYVVSEAAATRALSFCSPQTTGLRGGEWCAFGDGGELGGASLARIEDIGLEVGYSIIKRCRIVEDDPLSAQAELVQQSRFQRGDWRIRIECRSVLTCSRDVFQSTCYLDAFEGDECVRSRELIQSIPRKLV